MGTTVDIGTTTDIGMTVDKGTSSLFYAIAKRSLDIAVAILVLMVSSPVMLLVAVLVKLDSPGPAIFSQYRIGRGCRLFRFYKFRTMRVDAQETNPELYAYEYDPDKLDQVYLQMQGDPRITRLGRTLRRTSLDELPNLWNVLKGDMSMVGPRPEIPEMLRYYTNRSKFSVRPGVTGLAQTNGRGSLSFAQTVAQDEEYIRRRSFWLDLVILLKTPFKIVLENSTVGH